MPRFQTSKRREKTTNWQALLMALVLIAAFSWLSQSIGCVAGDPEEEGVMNQIEQYETDQESLEEFHKDLHRP